MKNKGQFSANNQPKKRGRPKGSVNKVTAVFNKYRPEFVELAYKNALNPENDNQLGWAGIVAKIQPAHRTIMPSIEIESTGNIKNDAKLVTQAMLKGDISPDQAQTALAVCRDSATLFEVEELEKLLDRLLAEKGLKAA
jgi:hypothetical protein